MRIFVRIVVVFCVAALPGCSLSNDRDGGTSPVAVSGKGRAGVWLGDLGAGEGVFVVTPENQIFGMVLNPDGSARSTIGNIGDGDHFTGSLDDHTHWPSKTPTGNAFSAQGDAVAWPFEYELDISEGQIIEGSEGTLVYDREGDALGDASPGAVDGTWIGIHTFDNGNGVTAFNMTLTFSGTDVTGSTGLDHPDFPFDHTIVGELESLGTVSLISFDWINDATGTTRSYEGVLHFAPDESGDLILNTDYVSGPGASNTLSSRLSRQ